MQVFFEAFLIKITVASKKANTVVLALIVYQVL